MFDLLGSKEDAANLRRCRHVNVSDSHGAEVAETASEIKRIFNDGSRRIFRYLLAERRDLRPNLNVK